jgi:enoyl-CoA hydratase/carnithine racemase
MSDAAPTAPSAAPDGEEEPLLVDVHDGIAVLTLNRPHLLNAFSGRMGQLLDEAYERCDGDDAVRVVVLTGTGRAFCSGADLSGGPGVFGTPGDLSGFRANPFRFPAWNVRKPVIAAVNGHAMGLGMTMALHCDLRIMARDAKYGIVQNRRGVLPDLDSHWTLPRLVGHGRATEILLTGKTFSGTDAERWGLANEVLDAPDVLPRAMELAREIATYTAPVSVGLSKRILWWDPQPSLAEVSRLETEIHLHVMGRPDAKEGALAFIEKREPRWSMTVSQDWPEGYDRPGR